MEWNGSFKRVFFYLTPSKISSYPHCPHVICVDAMTANMHLQWPTFIALIAMIFSCVEEKLLSTSLLYCIILSVSFCDHSNIMLNNCCYLSKWVLAADMVFRLKDQFFSSLQPKILRTTWSSSTCHIGAPAIFSAAGRSFYWKVFHGLSIESKINH